MGHICVYEVRRSTISGRGVFAVGGYFKDGMIGQAEIWPRDMFDGKPREPYYVQENEDGTESYFFGALRFLNHARPANADITSSGRVVALRRIKPGEEITIDYGDSFEESLKE